MKYKLLLLIGFLWVNLQAQEKEVENTIKTFFEGFHAKDTLKIKTVCYDKMILQSISEGPKGNKLTEEQPNAFFKAVATFPAQMHFQEKILKYDIRIDGTMAHAWTPYEFYINGKLSHSGVNSFQLFKENGTWKIIYIVDTRRK
ncbi:nuclear transport factor 2 family protein [Flavobacterium cerinum]|uniref:Nuclear transport factor 2 family protein n=1 Tax=Flavobacterium cerinum TaxID=2502784 RepID=A0ABY5ITT7_9FLAO|nr:nuclear transport factor 2 family protein [Flavobacterium cerinum]UUC44886.1 nuclear transport factor 2 family protein [Flavobacterium cerinum]